MALDPSIYQNVGRVNIGEGLSNLIDAQRQREIVDEERQNKLTAMAQQQQLFTQQQAEAKRQAQVKRSQELNTWLSSAVQSGRPQDEVMQEAIVKGQEIGVPPEATQRHVMSVFQNAQTPQARSDYAFTQANPELVAKQRAEAMFRKPEKTPDWQNPEYWKAQRAQEQFKAGLKPQSGVAGAATTQPASVDAGLFPNPNDPYKSMSQKAKETILTTEAKTGAKTLEESQNRINDLDSTDAAINRFIELNKDVSTGGIVEKVPGGKWAASFGPANSELQQLTAKLAPKERAPGTGATSDFDAKQFERATLSVEKAGPVNQSVAAALLARNQNERDYLQFRNAYFAEKGTLRGADVLWKKYADKNPILDKAKPGTYAINPNRVSWTDFFSSQAPTASAGTNSDIEAILNKHGVK